MSVSVVPPTQKPFYLPRGQIYIRYLIFTHHLHLFEGFDYVNYCVIPNLLWKPNTGGFVTCVNKNWNLQTKVAVVFAVMFKKQNLHKFFIVTPLW